jgi:hypothetical protein
MLAAVENAASAIARCRAEGTEADRLSELCNSLRLEAIAVDERLIVASKLPFPKRQRALLPLRGEVDEIEMLAHRIATSAIEARGHSSGRERLNEIETGLAHLDAARQELSDLIPQLSKSQPFWRRRS